MNRETFLNELMAGLTQLGPVEQRQVADYYNELIFDGVENGKPEEEIIAGFGAPEEIDPHVIEDGLRFRMGDAALEFIGTVHLVESYGVRLEAEGRTLAYSGDAGACPQLARVAAGADLFLCEATLTEGTCAEEGHHLRAATAGRLAAENGAKRLLLTHYHTPQAQTVLREARACFERAELTAIGKTWEVD